MSLADTIRAMAEAGMSAQQIADVVARVEETRMAKRRTGNAERQRRFRENQRNAGNAHNAVTDVTNVTETPPSSPPPKITNQTPSTPTLSTPRRAKIRSQLAEDAQPSRADGRAAADAGLTPDEFRAEWRAFRDHHRSKGNLMADWAAAWRTWIRNSKRFNSRAGPPRKPTIHDRLAQFSDDTDQAHDEPPYDGPTIDGSLAPGADDAGRKHEARGPAWDAGADAGWTLPLA